MSIHLYKHNEDAYRAVETMLEDKQMAAVIHPTGTGKSMIAFKLVEQHPHKHFLWISPSEYIYKTQLENIDTQFSNIEYMSYSRLMKHEDSIDTLRPDYIILDEFHRCGAAEWGKSVRKLLEAYPKVKRLGLSATNIRYLDNQRNMAEELFEGNIASEMTLGEAIVKEILPEPKYVIAMYSYKKELEQLKKRIEGLSNPGLVSENEKLLEQLKRALEQADGLTEVFARQMTKPDGKYIVFCSGREHMDEMKEQATDWFSKVDKKPHIYTAYYNEASTSKAFAEFKKDTGSHLKLLYCIDMLNEGIHKEYLFAKLTPKNKCIIIPGGGFLGTLWPNEEERVRRIINCFKDNKIIIFPQTVSYDLTSESGRKYLKQAQKIYSAHSNLTFFVREKQSYEIMQKYFPSVETVLVPDIVTLLDMDIAGQNRKDILFCMRSDLEKNVTDEQLAEIQQILKIHYPNEQMNKIDTVVPYMVSEGMRKKEVKNKLEQFKKAKLIITDRLHGMIFATITATPCIAFGNSNGKVKNVYGWLKHNEYIKYVNDIDEFKSIVETLDIERKYYYDKTILYDDFEPLLNIIKEIN